MPSAPSPSRSATTAADGSAASFPSLPFRIFFDLRVARLSKDPCPPWSPIPRPFPFTLASSDRADPLRMVPSQSDQLIPPMTRWRLAQRANLDGQDREPCRENERVERVAHHAHGPGRRKVGRA